MYIFIISGVLYGIIGFLEAARAGAITTNTGINYGLNFIGVNAH